MTAPRWTLDEIPDLTGRRALVTGVTSGIGEHTVLELARRGAEVVMAARDATKLRDAVDDVQRVLPQATLVPLVLDLADLGSIRRSAEEAGRLGPLDILVNNAGVMATPHRRTVDGFELQLGTNHLGHFALTGLLWPQLAAAEAARVVTVSSQMHRLARTVPLTDPRHDTGRRYQKWVAYAESKLANLLFAFELERRARRAGSSVQSLAAHPGYARTNLQRTGPGMGGGTSPTTILLGATRLLGQPSDMGAMPSLMAATMTGLPGGSYVGPSGPMESRGMPTLVRASKVANDPELAGRLWEVSEEATRIHYP